MRSRRRLRLFVISFRRQAIVWCVLFSYCATIFGMPLPSPPLKDVASPFPCQHRACGCMNAEQCWKGCCCFSPQERVAWANEHQVEPPAELVAQVEAESKPEDEGSCCQESEHGKKPTCHSTSQGEPKGPAKVKSRSTKKSTVWVLGMTARKCGGDATEWSDAPLALPSAAVLVTWAFEWLLVGWSSVMHILLDGIPTPPTVPPPR